MTREEFITALKKEGYTYKMEGDRVIITYGWSVYLHTIEVLPSGVEFKNNGSVHLDSLNTLPPGVHFKNDGNVWLGNLKTLPSGVEFKNRGDVWLSNLEAISPGVEFENGGEIDLSFIKTIPPGVNFQNGRGVVLISLGLGWLKENKKIKIEGVENKRLLNLMISKGLFV